MSASVCPTNIHIILKHSRVPAEVKRPSTSRHYDIIIIIMTSSRAERDTRRFDLRVTGTSTYIIMLYTYMYICIIVLFTYDSVYRYYLWPVYMILLYYRTARASALRTRATNGDFILHRRLLYTTPPNQFHPSYRYYTIIVI